MVQHFGSSKIFTHLFRPIYIFLTYSGHCPFEIYNKGKGLKAYRFRFGFKTIIYVIITLIYSVLYLLVTFGIYSYYADTFIFQKEPYFVKTQGTRIVLDADEVTFVQYEDLLIDNHIGPILTSYILLTLTFIGNLHTLINRRLYVQYFNYWNKAIEVIKADVRSRMTEFLVAQAVLCIGQVLSDLIFFFLLLGIRVISGVYSCFILRIFVDKLPLKAPLFLITQLITLIFVIYGHLGARVIIIQFMFFCRVLVNLAGAWNERLRRSLTTYLKRRPQELRYRREDFHALLKDHLVIVQLYKMTDATFSNILRTYYTSQMICLVLQLYHIGSNLLFYRTTSVSSNATDFKKPELDEDVLSFKRKNEFIESFLLLFIGISTIIIFSMVTNWAHFANYEGMIGFDIIRRRGLMNCETKTERNFIYTMIVNFARTNPITVSVDGYLLLNRTVTYSLFATLCGLMIHVYQIQVEKYVIRKEQYDLLFASTTSLNESELS